MKIYRNENPRGQTLVIMYDKRPNLNIFNNINKTDRNINSSKNIPFQKCTIKTLCKLALKRMH